MADDDSAAKIAIAIGSAILDFFAELFGGFYSIAKYEKLDLTNDTWGSFTA